jgi:D-ribulokinase
MLIGVDVGTGSARAGVFDATGKLLGVGKHPVTMWQEPGEIVEQSSDQIWQAVCAAVREAMAASGIDPAAVKGIGFDATCSLGRRRGPGSGHSRRPFGRPRPQCHRLDGPPRASRGRRDQRRRPCRPATMSAAASRPRWRRPSFSGCPPPAQSFAGAAQFFDLTDYLTWRATGNLARSSCTVTCKWTYLAHEGRWDAGYFRAIGLGMLADEGFARIGTVVVPPGTALGPCAPKPPATLACPETVTVAAALIDAHAGGLGTLGVALPDSDPDPTRPLAYIFGTSPARWPRPVTPLRFPASGAPITVPCSPASG